MKKKKKLLPLFINILIILFEIRGSVICFTNGINTLQYYTVLSNLLALVTSTIYSSCFLKYHGEIPVWVSFLRYTTTVCLTLTFVVVCCIFVPVAGPEVLYGGVQFFHHLCCPILSIVSFLFFENRRELTGRCIFFAVIPTLIYAAVLILLNALCLVVGPYPFLLVHEQTPMQSVVYYIIITGLAFVASLLLHLMSRRREGYTLMKRQALGEA